MFLKKFLEILHGNEVLRASYRNLLDLLGARATPSPQAELEMISPATSDDQASPGDPVHDTRPCTVLIDLEGFLPPEGGLQRFGGSV